MAISIPHSFTNGAIAEAAEVNANFNEVATFVNALQNGTGLDSGIITTAKLADSSVIASKLGSDAVTSTKILDAAVTGPKLANLSVSTKTANYTLVASDRNTRVVMNSASSTTITVNGGIFAAGDTVWIHNIGAGTCTVTAGTATVNTSGSLALAQWGGGTLYFTSASAAIFFPAGGVSYGAATGGSSSSVSISGVNYTLLSFTSTSTLTVTRDGLFDVLVLGGGSSGETQWAGNGRPGAGGGGAGGYLQTTLYLTTVAPYTITIGAGGAAPSVQMSINGGSHSAINASSATGQPIGLAVGSACGKGQAPTWSSGGYIASNPQMGGTNGGTVGAGDGGGGGGLGAAGSGRAGGAGKDFSAFLGSTVYLGGGGSGRDSGGGSSTGGIGGGGGAAPGTGVANAGTNTGGGGMGGADLGAGNGGSGIVYVRFRS